MEKEIERIAQEAFQIGRAAVLTIDPDHNMRHFPLYSDCGPLTQSAWEAIARDIVARPEVYKIK